MTAVLNVTGLVLAFPMALGGALLLGAADYVQRRGLSWSEACREAWDDFREELR